MQKKEILHLAPIRGHNDEWSVSVCARVV